MSKTVSNYGDRGMLPKSAKPFRFKVLQNWDDTVDLYAKDRATGHEDETLMDVVDEAMSTKTNEVEFMDKVQLLLAHIQTFSQQKDWRKRKEGITTSLDKMIKSLDRMVEKWMIKLMMKNIQEV
ncbi:hypothetical protein GmHk_18G051114 [Glycine max]|nr:hypothetical protein GmHk_18G051114 [Glycine max]